MAIAQGTISLIVSGELSATMVETNKKAFIKEQFTAESAFSQFFGGISGQC